LLLQDSILNNSYKLLLCLFQHLKVFQKLKISGKIIDLASVWKLGEDIV